MNDSKKPNPDEEWVLPGDKIAVIEEFLPDETCYEQRRSRCGEAPIINQSPWISR